MNKDEASQDHLFGPIPPFFFALLGKTIATAGLVELKVYDLVTSLDQVEQHVHAGQPLSKMMARCRVVARERFTREYARALGEALDDVRELMRQRNTVVHNVWTLTRDGRIHGWRPAPDGQRDQVVPTQQGIKVAPYGIASADWTEPGLQSLADALVLLQERLSLLRNQSEFKRLSV